MSKPSGEVMFVVDCRDLDTFIKKQTGRDWDTLENAGPRGLDYLAGNGMLEIMDARWTPDNWCECDRSDPYYSDSIWGQIELVEDWIETGVAEFELRTDSILCYLVREGKLDPGNYGIHLWW